MELLNKQNKFLFFVILITLLAFINILPNGFCIDDQHFIEDWPLIQDLGNFPHFFGSHNQPFGEEGVYSPLKTVFHAINYHFFGLNPLGYHVVSILIHLIATAFVFKICFFVLKDEVIAFLAAVIFGVHPVHVEAITSATGSVDTSGIMWMFVSFYLYIKYLVSQNKRLLYILSVFFGFLAVFTHELAITLPLVILFYEVLFSENKIDWKGILKRTAPYFSLVIVYVILKNLIVGAINRGGYLFDSFSLTMLVVVKALAKYIYISFLPLKLAINHRISKGIFSVDWQTFDKTEVLTQSIVDLQVLVSLAVLIALVFIAVKNWKTNKIINFSIGWFYICLLPVMNIIPTGSYFTERYLYPGSLGFCLILSYLLVRLYRWEKSKRKLKSKIGAIAFWLTMMIVLFYFVRTVVRNRDWRDYTTFIIAEGISNPKHPFTQKDISVIYFEQGDFEKAIKHIDKAILLRPEESEFYFIRGEIYAEDRNYTNAIKSYQTAIEIDPQFADAYYNLAGIYAFLGRMDQAKGYLDQAVYLYFQEGRDEEARQIKQDFIDYFLKQRSNEK